MIFPSIAPDLGTGWWTTPSVMKDIPNLWYCGSKTSLVKTCKKKSLAVELDP